MAALAIERNQGCFGYNDVCAGIAGRRMRREGVDLRGAGRLRGGLGSGRGRGLGLGFGFGRETVDSQPRCHRRFLKWFLVVVFFGQMLYLVSIG